MARSDLPDCKIRFFPTTVTLVGGGVPGGGGGLLWLSAVLIFPSPMGRGITPSDRWGVASRPATDGAWHHAQRPLRAVGNTARGERALKCKEEGLSSFHLRFILGTPGDQIRGTPSPGAPALRGHVGVFVGPSLGGLWGALLLVSGFCFRFTRLHVSNNGDGDGNAPKELWAMSRVHWRQTAQKRRKKMGSSVAYKTIGTFLSQNMGHEDACGWATEMQSHGCAAVRQWPTLSFTHWTCKFDLNSEFIR